jgi:prolyl oligopeptidase
MFSARIRFAVLGLVAPLFMACGGDEPQPQAPSPQEVMNGPKPLIAITPAPKKPDYPAAPKKPVTDTYGGLQVTDDYRWLEDSKDPNVIAWSDAENTLARGILDGDPQHAAISARVAALMGESSPSWEGVVARGKTIFALERRPPKQQPYLIVLTSMDALGSEKILVDPGAMDPSGGTSIGWFVPSPDGKRVAVALAKGGAEKGDIHVFDVATGKDGTDAVEQAEGAGEGDCLAWKNDSSGFFYTHAAREADAPKDGVYQRIYFHKLGDKNENDKLALGKDSPRIAQWEVKNSDDGKTIVARMEVGDADTWDHYLLPAGGAWKQIATKADGVKEMRAANGSLFLLSSKDAPKRKILKTSLAGASLAKAEVLLPEGDGVIDDFVPTKTRLYVAEGVGGPSRIRSIELKNGKPASASTLQTPAISAVDAIVPLGGDDVAFSSESFVSPRAWYRVSGKDGSVTKTAMASVTQADFSNVDVSREEATSKDGTKVPITIIASKNIKRDNSNPALLWGYGGYGITIGPRFAAYRLAWIEQGGVYAVANIRGGGEKGETWHSGGNLLNKQNGFDDFYACGKRLIELKYTKTDKLAIEGGSNGGLLMGAEITQHPEAWKAVVSRVGIYDMLRVELDPNGAFNVAEYGSVKNTDQLSALYAYSPYHHVKDGTAYPAIMFMTGANDPRVAPYHSRKFAARLQAATASNAPILLRTSANTGHGIGSPLSAQEAERADIYTFFFQQLGVTLKGSAPSN